MFSRPGSLADESRIQRASLISLLPVRLSGEDPLRLVVNVEDTPALIAYVRVAGWS
jgi:hypothetical protein